MSSIGVTGVVGSGKSLVLEILSELGARTIQADRIGHDLLEEEAVKKRVIDLLGDTVMGEDGGLDRGRIGQVVFSDPKAMEAYNAIIHPLLLERLRGWLDEARNEMVAVEAALIPEWGIEDWFDEVWCIECSDRKTLERWAGDVDTYWKIRAAQFAPDKKKAKAERVIENERSQEELRGRILNEWSRFRRKGCRQGRCENRD
jgi:dephospho-CoA kinase